MLISTLPRDSKRTRAFRDIRKDPGFTIDPTIGSWAVPSAHAYTSERGSLKAKRSSEAAKRSRPTWHECGLATAPDAVRRGTRVGRAGDHLHAWLTVREG